MEKIKAKIGGLEKDTYIRLLAGEREEYSVLDHLEELMREKAGGDYEIESENRVFERINNDKIIHGYKMVWGAFCILSGWKEDIEMQPGGCFEKRVMRLPNCQNALSDN